MNDTTIRTGRFYHAGRTARSTKYLVALDFVTEELCAALCGTLLPDVCLVHDALFAEPTKILWQEPPLTPIFHQYNSIYLCGVNPNLHWSK